MNAYWKIQLVWMVISTSLMWLLSDYKVAIAWAIGGVLSAVIHWLYIKCVV